MSRLIDISAHLNTSSNFGDMLKTKHDVSEGTREEITAIRTILGWKVAFYRNGRREILEKGLHLTEEELYDSDLLRIATISLLTGAPAGSKQFLWVDCSIDPAVVWIDGQEATVVVRDVIHLVKYGKLSLEKAMDQGVRTTIQETQHKLGVQKYGIYV